MMTFNFRTHSDNYYVSFSFRVSTKQRSITICDYLRIKIGNLVFCIAHCFTAE